MATVCYRYQDRNIYHSLQINSNARISLLWMQYDRDRCCSLCLTCGYELARLCGLDDLSAISSRIASKNIKILQTDLSVDYSYRNNISDSTGGHYSSIIPTFHRGKGDIW